MKYLLILLLAGCSTNPFATVPKEVSVPVIVPCVQDVPVKPASEFEASKGKSLFDQTKALLIDLENDVIFEAGLEAVISGCR